MVMASVPQHYINKFSDMIHVRAQQVKSRLRPYCHIKPMTHADFWKYDGVGQTETRELFSRNNPSGADDIDHWTRKIPRRRFVTTILSDEWDVLGRLQDPQGLYANACVAAMERRFDLVVYQAMFADVQTGTDFATTLTFAQDGGLTVNATAGLTLAKLLEGKKNFTDNEVGLLGSGGIVAGSGSPSMCYGITGDEESTLLQIATLTSGDYSRQYQLEKGVMTYAVGIEIIKFGANVQNPVLAVVGGVRTSFLMAEGAIAVGMNKESKITIKDRPELVDVTQIQVTMNMGACRTEGALIQKVTTTD